MADEKRERAGLNPSPPKPAVAGLGIDAMSAMSREVGNSRLPGADFDAGSESDSGSPPRQLTPEAQRALAEAEERRKAAREAPGPTEHGGRDGPEPVRYGDWENKGIAVDF